MKFIFMLLSFLGTVAAHADALQYTLVARLKEASVLPHFETERTWAASGYVPFSYFEYRVGSDSTDGPLRKKFRFPYNGDGHEVHTFRFHFKSFTEMSKFDDSRRLSAQLIESEKREITNQRQFNVYMEIVESSLQGRMQKLLEGRESELHKSVETSGQMMGLPKINVKDLVREMERLQKVDAEYEGIKAQNIPSASMNEKERNEASVVLIESVGALAKKMSEVQWNPEKLQIERQRLEARISRIDKEIAWSKDRKIIDHLDFQRNELENEESIRIGFNIPFLRFDNEDRARDKAILAVKESEIQRKESDLTADLRRQRMEVMSLAAQVESMKARLARTRGVSAKVKGVQDIELRAVLGDFSFELERDVILVSLKFYTKYLEYLRDQGGFAAFSQQNLLHPKWPEIKL